MKDCRTKGALRPSDLGPLCRTLSALCLGLCLQTPAYPADGTPDALRQPLPAPIIDPHSTEICLNSRISYHGGWNPAATEQMLADVLHATARAPITSARRVIYAATPENVYTYDAAGHTLVIHKTGDWRSDGSAAFEVGVAAGNTFDAGAAMHLAQLESIALWTGTLNQLASCPRASATTYANSNWNPPDPIDIVISYGMRNVAGLTDVLVAISSDRTLPDPNTDGSVPLDSALVSVAYDSTFSSTDLGQDEVSQLLWSSYGCSNHRASGGKAGLVCASAVANYYLTRRIYTVGHLGVYRFHNRLPPGGDLTTRDHRIELVTAGDVRPALRLAASGLPNAPHYLLICVGSAGAWPELEVGFAAVGALVQATTMGLQGHFRTDLSAEEQDAIRVATGIPSADLPMAVVSLGQPAVISAVGPGDGPDRGLALSADDQTSFGGGVVIRYELPADATVELEIYDGLGRRARVLVQAEQARGTHRAVWDCRDDRGRPVSSGVYFCRLKAGRLEARAQVVLAR